MSKQLFVNIVDKLQWIDRVVIYVWVLLSVLMIIAAWVVYQDKGISWEFWYIIALIAATWTYPLYTLGFKLVPGLIGNILYIALTIFVITQVRHPSAVASFLLYPVVLWVAVATVYVISQFLAKQHLE